MSKDSDLLEPQKWCGFLRHNEWIVLFSCLFLPWMTDAYGFARISLDSSYHWFENSEVHGMPGANLCMQPPCNHRRQWNLLPDCALIGFFQCICWGSWMHTVLGSTDKPSTAKCTRQWLVSMCTWPLWLYGHQPSLAITSHQPSCHWPCSSLIHPGWCLTTCSVGRLHMFT